MDVSNALDSGKRAQRVAQLSIVTVSLPIGDVLLLCNLRIVPAVDDVAFEDEWARYDGRESGRPLLVARLHSLRKSSMSGVASTL